VSLTKMVERYIFLTHFTFQPSLKCILLVVCLKLRDAFTRFSQAERINDCIGPPSLFTSLKYRREKYRRSEVAQLQ
jgi:hypothetical protein